MGLDSKGFHSSQTTNIIKVEKFILKVAYSIRLTLKLEAYN